MAENGKGKPFPLGGGRWERKLGNEFHIFHIGISAGHKHLLKELGPKACAVALKSEPLPKEDTVELKQPLRELSRCMCPQRF